MKNRGKFLGKKVCLRHTLFNKIFLGIKISEKYIGKEK